MDSRTVRRASLSDIDAIAPLFDAYRQFYGQKSDLSGSRRFLVERLERSQSVVFLALDGEKPVGLCQLYPSFSSVSAAPIIILNDLYVAPAGRRRGIGSMLLEAAAVYAREDGAIRLTLTTGVGNTAAQSLYRSCGWEEDREFLTFQLPLPVR